MDNLFLADLEETLSKIDDEVTKIIKANKKALMDMQMCLGEALAENIELKERMEAMCGEYEKEAVYIRNKAIDEAADAAYEFIQGNAGS